MKSFTVVLGIMFCAAPLSLATGQDTAQLQAAVQLAQDGNSDSARARVQAILAATPTTDPLYAEALYAAGTIAATAQEAQRYFRRVALEYSHSAWADDALLRVAQIRYVSHDALGTVRAVDRLLADYPSSPLIPAAAYWAARASIDLNDEEAACRWVDLGLRRSNDVETANQLRYFRGRCGGGEGAVDQPEAVQPPPPAGPTYRVQVAAVSTQEAAEEVAAGVRNLGYPVDIVRDGGLYKVRAGSYRERPPADEAVRAIRSRLGGQPFVVVFE